jgi:hypothetical protein
MKPTGSFSTFGILPISSSCEQSASLSNNSCSSTPPTSRISSIADSEISCLQPYQWRDRIRNPAIIVSLEVPQVATNPLFSLPKLGEEKVNKINKTKFDGEQTLKEGVGSK